MTTSSAIGQKLWNYCNVLRDAGLSYGDYLEQLTYLIFLKMMDERSHPPYTLLPGYQPPPIPDGYGWASLLSRDGDDLETHYRRTLETLGAQKGTLGVIFRKAQNKIQEPAMLTRLVRELIDSENWLSLSADVKGDAYESLLERNAQDVKTGAGQYFTPRPLIQAIVDVMRPGPDDTICDPASGTGGFLLAVHDYIVGHHPAMDRGQLEHLQRDALQGWEIVDSAARLCVMNLYLHGIGGDETRITVDDSLRSHPGVNYDLVLTNPPFGRKSSPDLRQQRGRVGTGVPDGRASRLLGHHQQQAIELPAARADPAEEHQGRAAIVVPDNVLFEGGAGETVRRRLLAECDAHTLLRLPTGVFYAQGVKANVLFFDRKPASETPWTKELWIYDLRTNRRFTLKTNPTNPRRPGRLRGLLQPREPLGTARGNGTLPPLQLRRPGEARQGQPGYLLAPRREHGGHSNSPPTRRHRRGNPGGPPSRARAVGGDCGGLGARTGTTTCNGMTPDRGKPVSAADAYILTGYGTLY